MGVELSSLTSITHMTNTGHTQATVRGSDNEALQDGAVPGVDSETHGSPAPARSVSDTPKPTMRVFITRETERLKLLGRLL